jgi:hypothetical protein
VNGHEQLGHVLDIEIFDNLRRFQRAMGELATIFNSLVNNLADPFGYGR